MSPESVAHWSTFLPFMVTRDISVRILGLKHQTCFSSGENPGVVLQDSKQPLLSWHQ